MTASGATAPDPTRPEIESEVLEAIRAGVHRPVAEADFDRLARALFAWQYRHNPAYASLCALEARAPGSVGHWSEIPAVPTGAFKRARLACFPPERDVRVFRTSGSTGERRGALHLDSLELYEASLLATFSAWILPDDAALSFLVLAPSASDAPDSSLSYMYDFAARRLGRAEPRFLVDAGGWDPEGTLAALADVEGPVALVGTAFAFVHLCDELDRRGLRLSLAPGSRIMETGGYKGRSRELTRDELHGGLATRLGVPHERIVNQYGMCELGSQFYEASLASGVASDVKRVPPWVRTRVVDPATFADMPPGEVGVLVHYDLANTGSVLAIATADAGVAVADGFRVLGRLEGAEARGCSLAADALLSASGAR